MPAWRNIFFSNVYTAKMYLKNGFFRLFLGFFSMRLHGKKGTRIIHDDTRRVTIVQWYIQYFGIYSGVNSNFCSHDSKNYIYINIILFIPVIFICYMMRKWRVYIWVIPAQIDLAVTLTILDFFCVMCYIAFQKNTVNEILDILKKILLSISPKITQKTENDTFGHYRFG